MSPSELSTAAGRDLTANKDEVQEASHNTTRDSVITIRLSQSTVTSTHDEDLEKESAIESPLEDSAEMVDIRLSDPGEPAVSQTEGAIAEIESGSPVEAFPQMESDIGQPTDDSVHGRQHDHCIPLEEVKIFQKIHRQSTMSALSAVDESISDTASISVRSRSDSSGTFSSLGSANVDWIELEKKEEEAPRDETSDESTAFLLARLEQENNALATDPKAAVSKVNKKRKTTRPPSIQHLQMLVNEPIKPSLRYSLIQSPPQMTELEFWAALVVDYPQTAQRLPTLTSNKIRGGIPPPLRGVVWMSIAGARERQLEEQYDRLVLEKSPYEGLISKDIGRSFPTVEMFRDPAGEGQRMLANVLKCFSLYDNKIGYCQGLGFVVGPLLMHMDDKAAFCVLVRLMEHYDLRSCFLPDLSGLHLRIFQFQQLLSRHLPRLTAHLEDLQIQPLYVSQWFLSFFAVTCPLPMLLRIYDIILTEGASETLMRVALSLMRRNKDKIMECTEIEDVMQLLLSRSLWDTYGSDASDLVNDFVGLTGLVTRECLEKLEETFRQSKTDDLASSKTDTLPSVQAAASRFLGRFWTASTHSTKTASTGLASPTGLGVAAPSRPSSILRRTPSKQSMASTLNSIESTESHLSTASTEATAMSRNPSTEGILMKSNLGISEGTSHAINSRNRNQDLHGQIEDLLTALSDMQREQAFLANELQKEREEREEDRAAVSRFIVAFQEDPSLAEITQSESLSKAESFVTNEPHCSIDALPEPKDQRRPLRELAEHFDITKSKRSSIQQTKHELREDVKLWKYQYEVEAVKSAELVRQLTDQEAENVRLIEQFRETRARMQEAHQDRQRLEKTLQELRSRRSSTVDSYEDIPTTLHVNEARSSASSGLREFRLGRASQSGSPQPSPTFSKRTSSLNIQAVLATDDHKPAAEEALLLELVNCKTSEAVARQELEEVKGKLDSLRRMLGVNTSAPSNSGHRPSPSEPCAMRNPTPVCSATTSRNPAQVGTKVTPSSSSSTGGFFSGWGKRMPSNPAVPSVTGVS